MSSFIYCIGACLADNGFKMSMYFGDDFTTPYDKILPFIVTPGWHVLPGFNMYALLL